MLVLCLLVLSSIPAFQYSLLDYVRLKVYKLHLFDSFASWSLRFRKQETLAGNGRCGGKREETIAVAPAKWQGHRFNSDDRDGAAPQLLSAGWWCRPGQFSVSGPWMLPFCLLSFSSSLPSSFCTFVPFSTL